MKKLLVNTKTPFIQLLQQKKGFLSAVYATLILQLVVTFAIIIRLRDYPELSKKVRAIPSVVWIVVAIALFFGIPLMLALPSWAKFIAFTALSVVFGMMLHVTSAKVPMAVIERAILGAMGVFVLMTVVGLALAAVGVDLGFMTLILVAALVGLLAASLIMWLMGKRRAEDGKLTKGYKALLYIGLVLFSIMVMYDTNMILQRNYMFDFVTAAMDFYLDFLNLFTRMLVLDGE